MKIKYLISNIVYIGFLISTPMTYAEPISRHDFVNNFSSSMTKQLCVKTNSPFASIYSGSAEDCQPTLAKYMDTCSKKVLPENLDPQKEGMQGLMVLSQCLMAHYQGGEVLATFNRHASTSLSIDKTAWLKSLRPVMSKSMCEQQDSDFGAVYQGENCPQDVDTLFTQCTTKVNNVIIPERIKDLASADHHAQVIAACITAHYVGGDALQTFLSLSPE